MEEVARFIDSGTAVLIVYMLLRHIEKVVITVVEKGVTINVRHERDA